MYIYILLAIGFIAYLLFRGKSSTSAGIVLQNINATDALSLLKDKNVLPLDVRTPAETAQGIIKRAKILNVTSLSFASGLRDLDKSKAYIVYCRSGKRSIRACKIMAKHGFEKLYNLEGGYNGWKS